MNNRILRVLSFVIAAGVLVTPLVTTSADAAARRTRTTSASQKKTTVRKASRSRHSTGTKARTRPHRTYYTAFDPARPQTLRAQAAVVVDTKTGEIVWAKNARELRPIASLTKLMTALVFLDNPRPFTDTVAVTMADVTGAGHSHVRAGNRVSIHDLIRCSLISSDNAATRALARSLGLTDEEYVRRMNERAKKMGLLQTHYAEMTGLDPENQSTALDQAKLLCAAQQNPTIAEITALQSYSFRCSRRIETLRNTNRLLKSRTDIVAGKTGYIQPAGYCLATLIGDGDRQQPHLTTVVLGAPTNSSRFSESAKLIEWAKRTFLAKHEDSSAVPESETTIGPAATQ